MCESYTNTTSIVQIDEKNNIQTDENDNTNGIDQTTGPTVHETRDNRDRLDRMDGRSGRKASPTIQQNATKRSHSNDTKTNESEDTHRNRTNPALVRQVAATGIGNRQTDSSKSNVTGDRGESQRELTDRTPKGLANSQAIFRDLDIDIGRESLTSKDQMDGGGAGSTSSVSGTEEGQTSSSLSNRRTTREDGDCDEELMTRGGYKTSTRPNKISNVDYGNREVTKKGVMEKMESKKVFQFSIITKKLKHNIVT